MAERHLTRRRFLAGGSAALASGLAGCTLAPAERGDAAEPGTDPPPIGDGDAETPTVERLSQSMDGSYADVYRDAVDSVAQIRVYAAQGQSGGTGWLYDGDYVVTNQHVVSRTDDQYVRFADGGWTDATVVGTDLYSDLAVLSVDETPDAAEPLSLLDSDPPVGTEVMAIGTPFGLSGSVSVGVVSGVNRTLPAANSFRIPDAIQTDAPVNPGNSGAPS